MSTPSVRPERTPRLADRLAAARHARFVGRQAELGLFRSALQASGPAHVEDMVLHRAIFEATANPIFVSSFDHMHDEIDRILRAGVDISRSRPPAAINAMIEEHELVVDAIRAQDGDAAALAMRWHLWQGRKRLMP